MSSRPVDLGPLGVVEVPPATGLLLPWRLNGELRATVIAKATFVIVPEGPMTLAEPEDVVPLELHYANSPARSVRMTSEAAPRTPRCDVILTGHACAPGGQPARWMPVRLAVFRDRALVDKTVYVYGDNGGEAPFERIPLVYERAYGGLGFRENPLGLGILELSSKPNLLHPERAEAVACFAPISRTWPARRRLVGAPERKAADATPPEFKDGFDWSYFQSAPVDQRVDKLHGDEWVVLEGMSATLPRVRSRLPTARAEARVYGLPGTPDGAPIALVPDILRIDADRMGCWLVWRADFAVPSAEVLHGLRVMVGVETEAAPIAWPGAEARASVSEIIELDSEALVPVGSVTLDEPEPALAETALPVVPFEGPAAKAVVPFVAGAAAAKPEAPPAAGAAGARPLAARPGGDTVAVEVPRAAIPAAKFGETLALSDVAGVPSMPFLRPAPTAPPPQWSPIPIETSTFAVRPPPESVAPTRRRPARAEAKTSPQGIALDAPASIALAVVPWGLTPARDCLAVIAKATCDLVPHEPATLRETAEPIGGDLYTDDDAGRACVHPTDLAPFKMRADVMVVGRAHAPPGGVTSMDVSFSFGHEASAFVRRIKVFGDRRWQRGPAGLSPSAPEVLTSLPIVPERAFGGAGYAANPVGMGIVDRFRDAQRLPLLPNLEDPDALIRVHSMRPPPACFAPLPASVRQRARIERRAPWPRFPEELDWTSHQAAPPKQRLPFLRGDEPFAITGMHRTHTSLEGSLPGVSLRAFAWREGDRFEEIELRLDTVVIDPDALKVSLVWRGVLRVASEAQPDVESVHVVIEQLGKEGLTLDAARAKFPQT